MTTRLLVGALIGAAGLSAARADIVQNRLEVTSGQNHIFTGAPRAAFGAGDLSNNVMPVWHQTVTSRTSGQIASLTLHAFLFTSDHGALVTNDVRQGGWAFGLPFRFRFMVFDAASFDLEHPESSLVSDQSFAPVLTDQDRVGFLQTDNRTVFRISGQVCFPELAPGEDSHPYWCAAVPDLDARGEGATTRALLPTSTAAGGTFEPPRDRVLNLVADPNTFGEISGQGIARVPVMIDVVPSPGGVALLGAATLGLSRRRHRPA